eukprot:COSAG06_NODE_3362_length_5453_cov_5.741688_7_plen_86_part_00
MSVPSLSWKMMAIFSIKFYLITVGFQRCGGVGVKLAALAPGERLLQLRHQLGRSKSIPIYMNHYIKDYTPLFSRSFRMFVLSLSW